MPDSDSTTAPEPTMPDPAREVRRSVHHLIKNGCSAETAVAAVLSASAASFSLLSAAGFSNLQWLKDIHAVARRMAVGLEMVSGHEDGGDEH